MNFYSQPQQQHPHQQQQYHNNQHNQQKHHEPSAPPRRKRSLSTSRFDSFQDHFQDVNYGFQNPQLHRMRPNFSTEHIPDYYNKNHNPNNGFSSSTFYPTNPLNNLRPIFINNQPSLLLAAMATPLSTRSNNNRPYTRQLSSPISSSSSMAMGSNPRNSVRSHLDYNPYQSKFNPALMAKPSLEMEYQTQISNQVATAIARGRDPMYRSKERLNQEYQYQQPFEHDFNNDHHVRFMNQNPRSPPARPPPPKLHSRFSMENLPLSSTQHHSPLGSPTEIAGYSIVDRPRRDRRSLSPTRVGTPGLHQRPYNNSRPTSPLPGSGYISPTQVSRTSSVNHHRSSRTPSREPSPMRTFFNFSSSPTTNLSNSSTKNLLSPKSSNSRSPAFFERSSSPSYLDSNTGRTSRTDYNNNDLDMNRNHLPMDELQVPTENFSKKHMEELKMNSNHVPHKVDNKQFSQAFTDHCDQYKSVTSKILGGSKKNNRFSGDFGDGYDHQEYNDVANNQSSAMIDEEIFVNQNTGHRNMMDDQSRMMNSQQQQQPRPIQNDPMIEKNHQNALNANNHSNSNLVDNFSKKLNEKLLVESMKIQQQQDVRRNSSSSNLQAYQRKASLPAEYIAKTAKVENIKLPPDWSRENVAQLAHEARERKLRPQSKVKERIQKIGVWFTKQFIFLLICALNILLAYVFYNLIADLPKD